MKTKVKHVCILIALFGMIGSNEAWGCAVEFAVLRTMVANTSTGSGKVYSSAILNPTQFQYQESISSTDSIIMKPDIPSTPKDCSSSVCSIQRSASYAFAKPDKGSRFVGWYRGNNFVSDEIPYQDSIIMPYDANRQGHEVIRDTLYAVFETPSTPLATSVTYSDASVTRAYMKTRKNTTVDVTIGRTFKRNGTDHTICLPFYLDSAELSLSPLAGFNKLQTFDTAEIVNAGEENETLVLHMQDAKMIEAGKPYLIAWPKGGEDIVNPTFVNATVTTDQPDTITKGDVSFCGTLEPYTVEKDDKGILFVGKEGALNWPNVGGDIKAFRSYFSVDLSAGASTPIRRGMAAHLGQSRELPTSIEGNEHTDANRYQKLMEQGRVVIESNGVKYDMNGEVVDF